MPSEDDTGRVEAFSDAVFAIAITLLILEVAIKAEGGSLLHRLAEQWPSYLSFVVTFAVIGIGWLQHQHMFRHIQATDHGLFVLNLVLLLVVCFIPFPTKVVGDELVDGSFADHRTAVFFYGLTIMAGICAFTALWLWVARRRRLIKPATPQMLVDARTRQIMLGIPLCAVPTLVVIWSLKIALALYGVIFLFYLLIPGDRIGRLLVRELRTAEPAPDGEVEEAAPSQEPQ
jgi:uncharacterized membrane protein